MIDMNMPLTDAILILMGGILTPILLICPTVYITFLIADKFVKRWTDDDEDK